MSTSFITGRGARMEVGRVLGKGGEGAVFELTRNVNQVAKLYHKAPDRKKQAKLAHMANVCDEQLLKYAAWPQDTLHKTPGGPVVGFVMPRIAEKSPIHMLYSPAHRRQDYPSAAWDMLLFAARNTAAAFSTLHDHGHILGDVNQGNVLVGRDTKVVLIDCDSFQILAGNEIYYCDVGVSHFTPPELQGLRSFEGVKRTVNHDNFGLVLVIFHLLFGGRHPYSGVPVSKEAGDVLENDIKGFRFAYSSNSRHRGLLPPPNSIPISMLPPAIVEMFDIAFTERGALNVRPTANQWLTSLDSLRKELRTCGKSKAHLFPAHVASSCPWCALETKGIVYFIGADTNIVFPASDFSVMQFWAMVNSIPAPANFSIPLPSSYATSPRPLPADFTASTVTAFMRLIVVILAIGLSVAAPQLWVVSALGGWIGWVVAGSIGSEERAAERKRRKDNLAKAKQEYSRVETLLLGTYGLSTFNEKKAAIQKLRDEYVKLPDSEKQEIDKLHANAMARQLHDFLDRCFIDSATISGVGPAKKAALRSFGIETAADVSVSRVRAVRGFGDVLTRTVIDWRKSCEKRFKFDPRRAISETDVRNVKTRLASRRNELIASLQKGAVDLKSFSREAEIRQRALLPQIEAAAKRVAQATADISILP